MRIIRLIVGMISTNCYVVESGGSAVVIDPGGDAERILSKVDGFDIEKIFLTHGHPDHIGGAGELQQKTKVPLYVHRDDEELFNKMSVGGFVDVGATPPTADGYLTDDERIVVGDIELIVLHTPGHTDGGVCFYTPGVLFSGDTLFAGSIGRTDLGGNMETLLFSIKDKLLSLPDDTRVLPGHGPESTIALEKVNNPFLVGL